MKRTLLALLVIIVIAAVAPVTTFAQGGPIYNANSGGYRTFRNGSYGSYGYQQQYRQRRPSIGKAILHGAINGILDGLLLYQYQNRQCYAYYNNVGYPVYYRSIGNGQYDYYCNYNDNYYPVTLMGNNQFQLPFSQSGNGGRTVIVVQEGGYTQRFDN